MVKLENGGNGWDVRKEKNKENKMGTTAKGKNGIGILKLDSTAFSIEGIGLACACCIRAKNITAIEKPTICMRKSNIM